MESIASQNWHNAFAAAFRKRVASELLKHPLAELKRSYSIPGDAIAGLLLSFRARGGAADDPLLFRYTRLFLDERYISTSDILSALLARTTILESRLGSEHNAVASGLPSCEERMFNLLAEIHMAQNMTVTRVQLYKTVQAIVKWLLVISEHQYNRQVESAGLDPLDVHLFSMYETLASLTIAIFGQASFRQVTAQPWWEKRRPIVVRGMQNFDAQVLQPMHSQFSGRLAAMTAIPPFVDTDASGRPVVSPEFILQYISQDITITPSPSRAGLYIWLHACLYARPMTDDLAVLSYLQNRYTGDNQSLTLQLIHAAFDVLTSHLVRGGQPHEVLLIRSFICNKLPVLLSMLATFTGHGTIEVCIQNAFLAVAMDPIPPISAGSSDATDTLRRARLDFLHACVMHGVATESIVNAVVQGISTTIPKVVKYSKDGLTSQCTNNIGRLESLVRELPIGNLCANKDTMSLKTVCNALVKRVPDIDIVLQHTQPAMLLLPLCTVLNDWVHDQDQSEFTPAYEEYAAVFLFTLAVLHRYGLQTRDIGFVANEELSHLLNGQISGTTSSELDTDRSQQLGRWLDGLFATDDQGETGGIGDEVMRRCPPQAFYNLVPTLLEQSVLACRLGQLPVTTFKSGLELLLEPFLLPSLVVGLLWVAEHSWEDHDDVDILLQILDKLLRLSSTAVETQTMHKAVLDIVAEPLACSLEDLVRRRPDKAAASGMLTLLRQRADTTRCGESSKSTYDQWAKEQSMDMHLRAIVRDMTTWAAKTTPAPPPHYDPRILHAVISTHGESHALESIATEIQQIPYANRPASLDVATSLLSSPDTASITLRHQLHMLVNNTQALLDMPAVRATTLVQLSRSVEAQLAVQQLEVPVNLPVQQSTDQIMQELGMADPSAAPLDVHADEGHNEPINLSDADLTAALGPGVGLDVNLLQPLPNLGINAMQVDESQDFFADLDMSLAQQQASSQLPVQDTTMSTLGTSNQEDDIFADLDMGGGLGDLDFNFS
ncbi:hypothetical protein LTR78_008219 [Recurvomyces mirabilis]|uniref:Mediator of RNA polymerase II transcription subunit 5 n=1 Tax=Recurvomyces mirabilis TaxID=574656 RepID=A0AAE0TTF1_9PEZI|nr:hypothetical protein LTR78_008219 [Recurvomyces mirabilis]KAK5156504.1 hypothetical protein LTS14_004716 [Recurvomyces mirabilis]